MDTILHTLAALYVRGASIDWDAVEQRAPRHRLALPTYPFERRGFWITPRAPRHPLLGRLMEQHAHAPATWIWQSRLDAPATIFLDGHRVKGSPVLPYSAFVEMALSATSEIGAAGHTTLKDLALHAPLPLHPHASRTVQNRAEPPVLGTVFVCRLSPDRRHPRRRDVADVRECRNSRIGSEPRMKFGLMFFASSEEALSGNKYQLVMESARFADANGFSSVWVPERHFTEFGSLYPNPAVLHAALAAATQRVKLVAGSVVAALHNPIRIAEEWSMVDNLSNGRVGVSFASGWNPDDFVFAPDKYASRQDDMLATMRTVQHLARRHAGCDERCRQAGAVAHLSDAGAAGAARVGDRREQSADVRARRRNRRQPADPRARWDRDQLAHKIALYRDARAKHGFDPAAGTVSVMLHTFVGDDAAQAREQRACRSATTSAAISGC